LKRVLMSILMVTALLGLLVSGISCTKTVTPTPTIILEITAKELLSAYQGNEVAADMTYKGKTVRVTGVVSYTGFNLAFETPVVMLGCGGLFGLDCVECDFSRKYEAEIAQLVKGQTITVLGRVSRYSSNYVIVIASEQASTPTPPPVVLHAVPKT